LSNPSSTNTVISYTIGGSATAGSDYTALTGTVTIFAGQLTATIDVEVLDDLDNLLEENETVIVTLVSFTGDANITVDATPATVTITDDDTATLSIEANDADAAEPDNDGQFTVTL